MSLGAVNNIYKGDEIDSILLCMDLLVDSRVVCFRWSTPSIL